MRSRVESKSFSPFDDSKCRQMFNIIKGVRPGSALVYPQLYQFGESFRGHSPAPQAWLCNALTRLAAWRCEATG